ncbi:MAG: HD domain-containing protein [Planctomycetota bacterium]|jgi:(p)ppGpp synthase/HD superfamily hydrolase
MSSKALDAAVWQRAASFAARAHGTQLRKDGRTPYYAHAARVGLTVAAMGFTDPAILAAALLHDTIEDTPADYDDIAETFGADVADLVACLTKDHRRTEPEREPAYDDQLASGPWQARLIKLADVYDNLSDAVDAAARRKLLGKARRALKLTEGDGELAGPREALRALVESIDPTPAVAE